MSTPAIEINKLKKIYHPNHVAVDDLDLTIDSGEILSLLGPNGAGKTSTIRVISTLCGFDQGKISVAGIDVDVDPVGVRKKIGVVAQQTGIDYFLTGRENLVIQGQLYRLDKKQIEKRINELSKYFELSDSLDKLVSYYSGGMRRKLDIATALIHQPAVLFLDEPTLGLDIRSRKMLWDYIKKLNAEMNLTILLTTHYLEEADSLSDRVAIINNGKIQTIGTPEDLKSAIRGDSVTISFSNIGKNEQAFFFEAKKESFVKESAWDDNTIHLYVTEGGQSIPKLMVLASKCDVNIENIALSRPTLDDVFLKYTGSSMLKEEETQDEWWKQWEGKGGDSSKWKKKWEAYGEDETNASSESQREWSERQWQQDSTDDNAGTEENWRSDEKTTASRSEPDKTSKPEFHHTEDQKWKSPSTDESSNSEKSWPDEKQWPQEHWNKDDQSSWSDNNDSKNDQWEDNKPASNKPEK